MKKNGHLGFKITFCLHSLDDSLSERNFILNHHFKMFWETTKQIRKYFTNNLLH